MKALTLTQPRPTLVALGAKTIETRSWSTRYRGPLLIHAAAGLGPVGGKFGLYHMCNQPPFIGALFERYGRNAPHGIEHERLPLGAVVAVVDLAEVFEILANGLRAHGTLRPLPASPERDFGDYTPGRYGWLLQNLRALPEPVPCKGAQGLWTPPPDVLAAVAAQLA